MIVFVEVKGRVASAATVTVTRNEVLTALNKPDDFYLAVVEVNDDTAGKPRELLARFEPARLPRAAVRLG